MSGLNCPVCGAPLFKDARSYTCENRHNYDIARAGYVNLLLSQKSGQKRHGDDKLMVRSRKAFLDKGYYACLKDKIVKICQKAGGKHIADIGCGEGYYTDAVYRALPEASAVGIDISRDALALAAKRNADIEWAVASSNRLPLADNSIDILLNLFAPADEKEFLRVLKSGGILVRAIALEKHLWGLKEKLYEKPYLNRPAAPEMAGFTGPERIEIRRAMELNDAADIDALFKMTPYYYKTSAADQAKLGGLAHLQTPIEFAILIYKKSSD